MARLALTEEAIRDRRATFLDVAEGLFAELGLAGVSLRRLAAGVGCSHATPYRYFATQGHVVLGLRIRAYQRVRDTLREAVASTSDPAERLRRLARAYVAFGLEHPDLYALLFDASVAGTPGEADPELVQAKEEALDVCRDALAAAEAEGAIRLRTDALTAAHLFWSAAHGAVSLHLGGQLVMGRDLEEIVPMLVVTLIEGLRAAPEEDRDV